MVVAIHGLVVVDNLIICSVEDVQLFVILLFQLSEEKQVGIFWRLNPLCLCFVIVEFLLFVVLLSLALATLSLLCLVLFLVLFTHHSPFH